MDYIEIVEMFVVILTGGFISRFKQEGYVILSTVILCVTLYLLYFPVALLYLIGYLMQGAYPIYLVEKKVKSP